MNQVRRLLMSNSVTVPTNICTVTFDDTDSSPTLAIEGDTSWIKGRRCLLQFDDEYVAHITYLSDDTSFETASGQAITKGVLRGSYSYSANSTDVCWMTELPEYWYHMDESADGIHVLNISPSEIDGWKHSLRVYVSVTEMAIRKTFGVYGSAYGGQSTGNETIESLDSFLYTCDGSTKLFELISYDTHCKIAHLFYAKYGNRNPQTMDLFGYGESSYTRTCGTTASLGNSDGHTDTQVSFLGIEDFYGGKYEFMSGINDNVGTYYIYQGLQPDQIPTVDYRTVDCGFTSNKYGYITNLKWGEYADMIPTGFNSGSSTTHYCDYGDVANSGWRVAVRSGRSASDNGGVAFFDAYYSSSSSDANFGSRIEYRGDVVVEDYLISSALIVGSDEK